MQINWTIFFFAVFFGLIQTGNFGWNMYAQSDAEIICDGITLLLAAIAFI